MARPRRSAACPSARLQSRQPVGPDPGPARAPAVDANAGASRVVEHGRLRVDQVPGLECEPVIVQPLEHQAVRMSLYNRLAGLARLRGRTSGHSALVAVTRESPRPELKEPTRVIRRAGLLHERAVRVGIVLCPGEI